MLEKRHLILQSGGHFSHFSFSVKTRKEQSCANRGTRGNLFYYFFFYCFLSTSDNYITYSVFKFHYSTLISTSNRALSFMLSATCHKYFTFGDEQHMTKDSSWQAGRLDGQINTRTVFIL